MKPYTATIRFVFRSRAESDEEAKKLIVRNLHKSFGVQRIDYVGVIELWEDDEDDE